MPDLENSTTEKLRQLEDNLKSMENSIKRLDLLGVNTDDLKKTQEFFTKQLSALRMQP